MTTGAEKLWNDLQGITPPKRVPPLSALPPPPNRPPDPLNSPLVLQSAAEPKEQPKMLERFWVLINDVGYDGVRHRTKDAAINHGQSQQANDRDNKPIYVMEAVAVLVRPEPKVEVIDL